MTVCYVLRYYKFYCVFPVPSTYSTVNEAYCRDKIEERVLDVVVFFLDSSERRKQVR